MIRSYFLFFLLVLDHLGSNAQQTKRVLFLGNSYTAGNNLPNLIAQMASSTGDQLIFDSWVPGGYRLLDHASDANTMNKISSSTWDYVTLQAQSQETSLGPAFLRAEVHPYAKALCDSIRSVNPCANPIFYMTWGRKNGDAQNCSIAPWVCTYQGMDSAICSSYNALADSNKSLISPVGRVWRGVRQRWPGMTLYMSDNSHPHERGSYRAACTFYSMIFKKDPTLINFNYILSQQEVDSLQMVVKRLVYDSLFLWDRTQNLSDAKFQHSTAGFQVQFSESNSAQDSLIWDFGDGTSAKGSKPVHTYQVAGNYSVELRSYNCSDSSSSIENVIIASQASAIEHANKEMIFYPNPARDEVKIESSSVVLDVELWSALGRRLRLTQSSDRWLLPNISAGSYVLKITTAKGLLWRRIQID